MGLLDWLELVLYLFKGIVDKVANFLGVFADLCWVFTHFKPTLHNLMKQFHHLFLLKSLNFEFY